MKAVAVSALSSGQGKTLFTMALIHWLKTNLGSVRPFKVGPDYIDTKFHEKIAGIPSVNLDLYMMTEQEVNKSFQHYSSEIQSSVIEGVMGFYDGIDYGSSTYEVAKTIGVPTILLVSAEGSYSTIIPMIKGMLAYRTDNTIKGVILNKVSSLKHFEVIEKQIKKEIPEVKLLGWIPKGLATISSRHLGLDLTELDNKKLDEISESVMKNINISDLLELMEYKTSFQYNNNLFDEHAEIFEKTFKDLTVTIVLDKAFSFTYLQNLDFLKKFFKKATIVSALADEEISTDTDIVYLPGGYVETPEFAPVLDRAVKFKKSLLNIANDSTKRIYAECAGLMFLGEKIQTTDGNWINGTGILPINFELQKTRHRLGYYKALDIKSLNIYKGHSFHYSKPVTINDKAIVEWGLFKDKDNKATAGAWINKNVLGTYLHTMFFNQPELMLKYFNISY